MLKESEAKVSFQGQTLTDARWLAKMPQTVWDTVREEALKC